MKLVGGISPSLMSVLPLKVRSQRLCDHFCWLFSDSFLLEPRVRHWSRATLTKVQTEMKHTALLCPSVLHILPAHWRVSWNQRNTWPSASQIKIIKKRNYSLHPLDFLLMRKLKDSLVSHALFWCLLHRQQASCLSDSPSHFWPQCCSYIYVHAHCLTVIFFFFGHKSYMILVDIRVFILGLFQS